MHDYGIKIVNIKDKSCYDLYMGRANKTYNLQESKWHNPFVGRKESERNLVIEQYKKYVYSRRDLLICLPELKNKTLACWCFPKKCHINALIEIMNEIGFRQ